MKLSTAKKYVWGYKRSYFNRTGRKRLDRENRERLREGLQMLERAFLANNITRH